MIYDISLRIRYDYASLAASGRHIACVMPRDLGPQQRLVAGLVTVAPRPGERIDRTDFFGNRVVEFGFRAPHDGLAVTLTARVDRRSPEPEQGPVPVAGLALQDLPLILADNTEMGPASPLHFLQPSVRVPRDAAMTAFARAHTAPDMTVTDAVLALGGAVHRHMTFDPDATTVDTPATEAFSKRHGVCQDFSHILLACLRGIGVPAAYVSGFLRTLPPPGKPRLEGADAMHAWVQVWCGPQAGWLAFDPTNDRIEGEDHIVVAYGRDYSDVAPIKGILRGSGRQQGHHEVDVVPVPA